MQELLAPCLLQLAHRPGDVHERFRASSASHRYDHLKVTGLEVDSRLIGDEGLIQEKEDWPRVPPACRLHDLASLHTL